MKKTDRNRRAVKLAADARQARDARAQTRREALGPVLAARLAERMREKGLARRAKILLGLDPEGGK